jgi:hypothetical protein
VYGVSLLFQDEGIGVLANEGGKELCGSAVMEGDAGGHRI